MNPLSSSGGKKRPLLPGAGPASHTPAPHYMGEKFDIDHVFRDLLNEAKDLNPDLFARHYFTAAQEHRLEAAENPRAFDREQEIDDLFGVLMDRLFDIGTERTAAQEAEFITEVASCCASLDILQETN